MDKKISQKMNDLEFEFIFVNDCTKDKSISILDKVIQEYPERHSFISILNRKDIFINADVSSGLYESYNVVTDNGVKLLS